MAVQFCMHSYDSTLIMNTSLVLLASKVRTQFFSLFSRKKDAENKIDFVLQDSGLQKKSWERTIFNKIAYLFEENKEEIEKVSAVTRQLDAILSLFRASSHPYEEMEVHDVPDPFEPQTFSFTNGHFEPLHDQPCDRAPRSHLHGAEKSAPPPGTETEAMILMYTNILWALFFAVAGISGLIRPQPIIVQNRVLFAIILIMGTIIFHLIKIK